MEWMKGIRNHGHSLGDFMTKTIEEAYNTLIDNLAGSQTNPKSEYDHSMKSLGSDSHRTNELNAKLELLMKKD